LSENIFQSHKLDDILKKFLYFIFFIFTFFPFISFLDLGTDMQPYGLAMAIILFFLFKNIAFNRTHILFLSIFLFSIIIFLASGISFVSSRSLFNYLQLFFISFVSYQILKTERINFEFFLKFTNLTWFLVGLIQTFVNKSFLTFLIRDPRIFSDKRGVVSLASEPTFYGIVLLFFALFFFHTNYKNKTLYIFLSLIGIIFFAKSSMVFLFIVFMFFTYFLTHFNIRSIIYLIFITFFVPFLIIELMPASRITYLIAEVINRPVELLYRDISIFDRLIHIIFSLKGFYDNHLLPNGFLNWENYLLVQLNKYTLSGIIPPDFIDHYARARSGRIMSGYGSAFFEIGIIAVLIPFALISLYFFLYKEDLKKFFFFSIFVNGIMFSAIPIGFSLFAFYVGFLLYLAYKKQKSFT
jgi:hypothetical protein